jgi:hypothetical protein
MTSGYRISNRGSRARPAAREAPTSGLISASPGWAIADVVVEPLRRTHRTAGRKEAADAQRSDCLVAAFVEIGLKGEGSARPPIDVASWLGLDKKDQGEYPK